MATNEVYNVTFEDVEKTAQAHQRVAVRIPGLCVVVMDDTILHPGFIRQFTDDPYGYAQARRWAVRMDESDIESDKTLEDIEAEWERYLDETDAN